MAAEALVHRKPIPNPEQCLGIAVDHRIQALFAPLQRIDSDFNVTYASRLLEITNFVQTNVRRTTLPQNEIRVTQSLARPKSNGDIIFLLLQPANYHPFHEDKIAVIGSSPTLDSLDQALWTASSGSLSLSDVTVLDSLPFIRPKDRISPRNEKILQGMVLDAVWARKPRVVFCASKKEYLQDFTSLGVGKVFHNNKVTSSNGHTTVRVNAFHPSHAVNFNRCTSTYRQLLLLEVSQACRESNGDWTERAWMDQLRARSGKLTQDYMRLGEEDRACSTDVTNVLHTVALCAESLAEAMRLSLSAEVETRGLSRMYSLLVDSGVCRDCNDIQLCLLQILDEKMSIHPEDFAKYIPQMQKGIGECSLPLKAYIGLVSPGPIRYNRMHNTTGLIESDCIPKPVSLTENHFLSRWRGLLYEFMLRLNSKFMCKSFPAYEADIETLAAVFLDFAIAAERLLGEIMQKVENMTGNENAELEDAFGALSIAEDGVN